MLGLSKKGATVVNLPEAEYTVLRQTIASRGTARLVLLPIVIVAWAALARVVQSVVDRDSLRLSTAG